MLDQLNQELKRLHPLSPDFSLMRKSCLRLIRALAVEIHEDWIEAHRYLNMEILREQRKTTSTSGGRLRECDGLFTNRLLWLGASAGALPTGSGCHNLAMPGVDEQALPFPSSYLVYFLLNLTHTTYLGFFTLS